MKALHCLDGPDYSRGHTFVLTVLRFQIVSPKIEVLGLLHHVISPQTCILRLSSSKYDIKHCKSTVYGTVVSGHVLTCWSSYLTRLCLSSPSLIISCVSPLYSSNKEERAQNEFSLQFFFVIALLKVIGFYTLGCYLVSLMFKFTIIKTCPVGFSCTRLTLSVLRE